MFRRKQSQKSRVLPREYLYTDHTRLNSYVEQISSTEAFDKIPSFKLSIGITKLEVNVEQSQRSRQKTDHEKIIELIAHLKGIGGLATRRPRLMSNSEEDPNDPVFVLERCEATRILVPATSGQSYSGIPVWVSEWPEERFSEALRPPGLLCLIEDESLDDRSHRAGFSHSAYSWLQALLLQLNIDPRQTTLRNQYPISPWGDYTWDIMRPQDYLMGEMSVIRTNPIEWLRNKGCSVSGSRFIECLYRIRNSGIDQPGTGIRGTEMTVSTFAYAIAIWASSPIG